MKRPNSYSKGMRIKFILREPRGESSPTLPEARVFRGEERAQNIKSKVDTYTGPSGVRPAADLQDCPSRVHSDGDYEIRTRAIGRAGGVQAARRRGQPPPQRLGDQARPEGMGVDVQREGSGVARAAPAPAGRRRRPLDAPCTLGARSGKGRARQTARAPTASSRRRSTACARTGPGEARGAAWRTADGGRRGRRRLRRRLHATTAVKVAGGFDGRTDRTALMRQDQAEERLANVEGRPQTASDGFSPGASRPTPAVPSTTSCRPFFTRRPTRRPRGQRHHLCPRPATSSTSSPALTLGSSAPSATTTPTLTFRLTERLEILIRATVIAFVSNGVISPEMAGGASRWSFGGV